MPALYVEQVQRWKTACLQGTSQQQAEEIFVKVLASIGQWREIANQIGISRAEQNVMKYAFNIE